MDIQPFRRLTHAVFEKTENPTDIYGPKKSTVLDFGMSNCPSFLRHVATGTKWCLFYVHPAGYSWHLPHGHFCLYNWTNGLHVCILCAQLLTLGPLDVSGLGLNAPFYLMHPPQKNDNWYSKVVLTFPIPAPKLMGLRWSKAHMSKMLKSQLALLKTTRSIGIFEKKCPKLTGYFSFSHSNMLPFYIMSWTFPNFRHTQIEHIVGSTSQYIPPTKDCFMLVLSTLLFVSLLLMFASPFLGGYITIKLPSGKLT